MLDSRGALRTRTGLYGLSFARFGNEARIYGDSQSFHAMLETVGGEVHVKAQPVEILTESLTVSRVHHAVRNVRVEENLSFAVCT